MAPRDRRARDHAHQLIRESILTMRLPPGAKVDESSLAAEIDASRTPVREALNLLATEGLILAGPRGGYHVSSIDLKDCRDLFEAQLLVVRATTQFLLERIDASGVKQLEQATTEVENAVAADEPAAIARKNAELHILESRLAGNPYIAETTARVYTHTQRLAYMSFIGTGPLKHNLADHHARVCMDHRQYLDAVRTGDEAAAHSVAIRHIELFRDRILDYLRQDSTTEIIVGDLSGFTREFILGGT